MAGMVDGGLTSRRTEGGAASGRSSWLSYALLPALLALAWFAGAPVSAAERLQISQVRQMEMGDAAIRVYADLQDAGGAAAGRLRIEDVAATLGPDTLDITGVRSFAESTEGVGYIFLVDVSASLDDQLFGQIVSALDGWIGRMRPQDRAALVSFGTVSRVVRDWTDDFAALRGDLSQLGPTDQDTLLHQALLDALDLGERRDEGLPGRRVIVVLTDGRDESSGRALDDVLGEVRRRPTPIYSIGFSRLSGGQRVTYLDVLRRLSANSGGSFFEAEETEFAEAYDRIAEAVHRVWVIDATCGPCQPDGRNLRLQLSVRSGNRVLSRGADIRLLPGFGSGGTTAAEGATPAEIGTVGESTTAPGAVESAGTVPPAGAQGEQAADAPGGALRRIEGPFLLWIALIALMLALIVIGAMARRSAKTSEDTVEILRHELERSRQQPAASAAPGAQPGAPAAASPVAHSADTPAPQAMPHGDHTPTPSGMLQQPVAAAPSIVPSEEEQLRQQAEHREELVRQALENPNEPAAVEDGLFMPRSVRLVTVRGEQKGKQYRGIIRSRLSVGARSTNDVVLAGESTVPPELFALVQENYRLRMIPLSEQPVLCNGLALDEERELQSGDLIGTHDFILRLVLDGS